MRRFFLIIFFIPLFFTDVYSCFGPELFIGYEKNNSESYIVANLLDIYIKEKTGINVVLGDLDRNIVLNMLKNEKIDILTFPINYLDIKKIDISSDKKISVYYRKKIEEDLRFESLRTTLVNLSRCLTKKDIEELTNLVEKKGKVKRTIKEYLMERGIW